MRLVKGVWLITLQPLKTMCSAPKVKTPKVNPYVGMTSDPKFASAAKELGISNVNNEDEVRRINEYIMQQDIDRAARDPNFNPARDQLLEEGVLKPEDKLDAWYLSQVQDRMYTNTADQAYADQKAETDQGMQDFKDMMSEQSEAQAEMMEKMMNAPKYMARQAPLAPVTAPVVTPEPIPVAPPTPRMEIQKAPPAPELTTSPQNMAIVKQSASSRSRQRLRSRGTSLLSA